MNILKLQVEGYNDALSHLTINGKSQKLKKNDKYHRECELEIEGDKAEILIYKTHNYVGKNWFWWNLLYFFISVFGLFDISKKTKCIVVDCRFTIHLTSETNALLKVQNFSDGGKFLQVETQNQVDELANIQIFDKEAQKRQRKMKNAKVWMTALGIVAIVAIVAFVAF